MGNRIAKHIYSATGVWEKSTYYVRDASGNTMAVYEKVVEMINTDTDPELEEVMSYQLTERHIYGSSRLGMDTEHVEMIGEQPDTLHRRLGLKQYELSNHLGNVLSVITDIKLPVLAEDGTTIISYTAVVISATDYTAFGVALYGRTWSSDSYRYGFNGKEKDSEGMGGGNQTYDYGFRIYNPALAKFLSVDPLCQAYPWNSTYAFAENEPISNIDLDGLEKYHYMYEKSKETGKVEIRLYGVEDIIWIEKKFIGCHYIDQNGARQNLPNGKELNFLEKCSFYFQTGIWIENDYQEIVHKNEVESHVVHKSSVLNSYITDDITYDETLTYSSYETAVTGATEKAFENTEADKKALEQRDQDVRDLFLAAAVAKSRAGSNRKVPSPIKVTTISTKTTVTAYKHKYTYSPRVRERGTQDPSAHNFPYSFDDVILSKKPYYTDPKTGYQKYSLEGYLNGNKGRFEIGLDKNGVIDHRTFTETKIKTQ
jgi:RHS repeat-associated protein